MGAECDTSEREKEMHVPVLRIIKTHLRLKSKEI